MNNNLAAYWHWYSENISRPRIGADVTVPEVRSIHTLRDAKGTTDDPFAQTIDVQKLAKKFQRD